MSSTDRKGIGISPAMLLSIDSVIEGITGLALILFPSLVIRLLFGAELVPIATVMSRIAGMGILSLAVGCWLGRQERGETSALLAMLLYNILTMIYLGFLGIQTELVGQLLWPAVVFHAAMAVLFAITWSNS